MTYLYDTLYEPRRPQGCFNSAECAHCHMCLPGELKRHEPEFGFGFLGFSPGLY